MNEDELQDDQLEADGDIEDAAAGSDNSAPPKQAPAPEAESKRVNDLMSKWQAEQARANKLEAQLKARSGGSDSSTGGGAQGDGSRDAELDEFKAFARESARTTLFQSDPRLADAGLSAEDIAGSTLAEMQASMKKHQGLIAGIEGRMRNRILSEHGLDPDVATGAGTEKTPSFSTMTDEEFAKFLAARDSRSH